MKQQIIITIEDMPDEKFKCSIDFQPELKSVDQLSRVSHTEQAVQIFANRVAAGVLNHLNSMHHEADSAQPH